MRGAAWASGADLFAGVMYVFASITGKIPGLDSAWATLVPPWVILAPLLSFLFAIARLLPKLFKARQRSVPTVRGWFVGRPD